MPTVDLVLKNARVVTPGGIFSGGVAVEGGRIVSVCSDSHLPTADETVDAKSRFLIPGVIDPEAHLGTKKPFAEDVRTETRAAAAAGVTTWGFIETVSHLGKQSDDSEPASFNDLLPSAIDGARREAVIDFFLTPVIQSERHAREIPEYAERFGITSFKYFTHQKNPAYMRSYKIPVGQASAVYDDRTVYLGMDSVSRLGPGARVCLHCENSEVSSVLEGKLRAEGRRDIAAWTDKSPNFCEALNLRTYLYMARFASCPVYNVHTTTPESLKEILGARAMGVDVVAQTGPHYLTLTKHTGWRVNVPLRDSPEIEVLWDAIARGIIDCIGSDHVCHGPRETLDPREGIWGVQRGFSSRVEALLPVMLSEGVAKGRISIERLVEVCSRRTAVAFGIYPKKGAISVGSDADLVLVDPKVRTRLSADMVNSWTGWSIYEGWEFTGWPVMVFSKGTLVARRPDGEKRSEVVAPRGTGDYLSRRTSHPRR